MLTPQLPDQPGRPIVIGHRGAPAEITENTLASFARAVEVGAAMVEFDVHTTADGHLVVLHDATVDRMADESSPVRTGAVADLPWSTVRRVVLRDGHTIPTLDEVLDAVGVPMMLEIKAPSATDQVVAALRSRDVDWELSRVISFRAEALARVKELAPQVPVAPICFTVDEEHWALVDRLDAVSVISVDPVPTAVVDRAHEAGRTVVINGLGVDALAQARAAGVDYFCTDDPRVVAGPR